MYKKCYTTGEASRIIGVAPRTIAKACDSGVIRSWRIATEQNRDGDRRIEHDDLLEYMVRHKLPARMIEAMHQNGVLLSDSTDDLAAIQGHSGSCWRWRLAQDPFQAGVLHGECGTDAMIVDMNCGSVEAGTAIAGFRKAAPDARIAVILAEDGQGSLWDGIASRIVVRYTGWDWVGDFLKE